MKIIPKGYLALILHAHLPFVRHPEHDSFLEENWLFEAITDAYVPIVMVFDRLVDDGVDFRVTLSISPTLICMLRDDLLISRYIKHLDGLIDLSAKEIERTRETRDINRLAVMYHEKYRQVKHVFCGEYGCDITRAFKKFQDLGKIEIITACATHGYLPLMDQHRPAVRAQVKTAVDTYAEVFGRAPRGIWLPECGYHSGFDEILKEFGIRYFFAETHGVLSGTPPPKYGVYSPYICSSAVAVFARDIESSKAVWSAQEGYPGDHRYREYYRDIGFDLEYDYIKPFINGCGKRINTGIKYHKITGRTEHKDIYNREDALKAAREHAIHFISGRKEQIEKLARNMDRAPIITAPYDAELFGHWWFEGPEWLELLVRKMQSVQNTIGMTTPGEYMELYDHYPASTPAMSSWGYKGYNEVWLDGSNDWIYRHLHKMAELMTQAARDHETPTECERRTLNQMSRELMLAQSSDWAFIMKTGTFTDYAVRRTREHISTFLALHDGLCRGDIDMETLEDSEDKHNLFENMDYKVYA